MAEYRVTHPPQWRPEGAKIALHDPTRDAWVLLAPWTRQVLEGIQRGDSVAAISSQVALPAPRKAADEVRRFLFGLASSGHLEILFETPPAVFARRYAFVKELGRGGVGVAYLCRDEETGVEVVVKRAWDFLQPYSVTEAAIEREARVLRALDHPGIPKLLDSFTANGHLHLVREFVRGASLETLAPVSDARERRRIAREAGGVVAHLHDCGFLLLDLRPANFLVDLSGRVVLLDVGQARAAPEGVLSFKKKVGSPGFISPEMRSLRVASRASDVWGLGRLFAFLSSGRLASKSDSLADVLARSPVEDRVLLEKLLAEDPSRRPLDARSLFVDNV